VHPRNRLVALSLMALLVLSGALAGAAVRGAGYGIPFSQAGGVGQGKARSVSDAFVAVADVVTASVVRIEVERTIMPAPATLTGRLDDLWDRSPTDAGRPRARPQPVPQLGGGSGFIITADGYILTNHHVVAGADRIRVTLRDKRTHEAVIVGADPATDIAVLRIEARGLEPVTLGNSDDARVGEWVLAIGNPGFEDTSTLDFTVTGGIISAKGRPLNILGAALLESDPAAAAYAIEDFIQTDAVINPGNSGGPLVDLRGKVIGINTAIASTTGYSQGYGFAIPSNLVRRVVPDLIEHGYVRRPLLGVSIADVTEEDAEVYGLQRIAGVVVEDFADESPAARSGLQRHDVIVAVDGTPVERVGHLQRLVALHRPGESVDLSVVRYGSPLRFRVRLTEAPAPVRPALASPTRRAPGLGLELEELTPQVARQLGFGEPGGALIGSVAAGSPADRRNILARHRLVALDRQPVASANHGRAMIQALTPGAVASLTLEYPDGRTYIANIRVP
jgi:serine protease Do